MHIGSAMSYEIDGKRGILTGATGFLGRHLAPRLADVSGHLDALVRSPEKARRILPDSVEGHVGDVSEPETWPDALEEADFVVHLANPISFDEELQRRVTVRGTRRLARRTARAGADRFLYTSSVSVYGFSAPEHVTETTPYGSDLDPYGRAKQRAEEALIEESRGSTLQPVIVQPSAVYGPCDETWSLTAFEMARDGAALAPDGGEGWIHFVYVEEAVSGILAALRRGRPGERYILSGPEVVTVKQHLEYYLEMAGGGGVTTLPGWLMHGLAGLLEWTAPLFGVDPPLTRRQLRYIRMRSRYGHEKATRELGFEPTITLEEGIPRVKAWLEEEGLLSS